MKKTTEKSHPILKLITGSLSLCVILFYGYQMVPHQANDYKFSVNIMIVLYSIAIVCNVVLFVALLRMKAQRGPTAWFMFLPLLNTLWLVVLSFQIFATDPLVGHFWQRTTPLAWVAIPIMILFFVLSYIDEDTVPRGLLLWVLPLIAVFVLLFVGGRSGLLVSSVPQNQERLAWGWDAELTSDATLAYVWAITIITSCLVLIYRSYRRAKSQLARRQHKIFLIGLSVYVLAALVFDILYPFTPQSDEITFPPMTFAYSSAMVLIIGYGIIKFGIFRVSPAALSGPILHSLSEAVVATDRDMVIQFTNQGIESIAGYEPEALRGEGVQLLFEKEMYERVAKAAQESTRSLTIDDTLIKSMNSEMVNVSVTISPVMDDMNAIAGYIFVFANITELKKKTIELAREKLGVEQKVLERTKQLSEEHARLTASIDSLNIGYLMTTSDGQISLMNPTANRLLSRLANVAHVMVPTNWRITDVTAVLGGAVDMQAAISTSQSEQRSSEFAEARIGDIYLHVFVAPVVEHENVIGSVILLEDISEQKILARSKDEFFVIASHELRTPLTKIRGSAELVRDVYGASIQSEEALKMLTEIEGSSAHLIDIVNSFIEMSELELGKVHLDKKPFDVIATAREVLQIYEDKPEYDAVSGSVEASSEAIEITGDQKRVRQVLQGLISNAYKFSTVDGGSVRVSIDTNSTEVLIRVRDTGKGIAQENQKLLFRKFQQAGKSLLSRDGEGVGLGLYIMRLIVRQMGGDIALEQSIEGKGSTFIVRLPLHPK